MNIIKLGVIILFLATTVLACIGNPNGISLSFPIDTINIEKAYEFCEFTTCLERKNSIVYVTKEKLAVSVHKNKINVEIPVTEEGQPVLNFTNWKSVIKRELTRLAKYGVVKLTNKDIEKIVNSSYVKPGAVLSYENAEVQPMRVFEGSSYCSGQPILINELPKQEAKEKSNIKTLNENLGPTGNGKNIVVEPSFKEHVYNYWWIPLLILPVIFLVFKLQLGGKNEVMSLEDLMVLSAPRRIEMMKSLAKRRKTLTELSKEANISLPTAKEHLEKLEKSGLVRKIDTGHKWKYYELTKKGKRIVDSTEFKDN